MPVQNVLLQLLTALGNDVVIEESSKPPSSTDRWLVGAEICNLITIQYSTWTLYIYEIDLNFFHSVSLPYTYSNHPTPTHSVLIHHVSALLSLFKWYWKEGSSIVQVEPSLHHDPVLTKNTYQCSPSAYMLDSL